MRLPLSYSNPYTLPERAGILLFNLLSWFIVTSNNQDKKTTKRGIYFVIICLIKQNNYAAPYPNT
jgi:hypothetical protein